MRRFVLAIAIASLPLTAAVSAEPAKAPVRDASQPVVEDTPLLVASADTVSALADKKPAPPRASDPAKPVRHARVTSCRCGDQTPPSN
jgi:hypothetical protein